MKLRSKLIGAATFFMPLVALAQIPNTSYIDFWIGRGKEWLNMAIVIIMVLMTFFFLLKVFQFISAKDATKQAEKKKEMFNALIGLFVAVSVWGIIGLVGRITGIGQGNAINSQPTCPPGYTYDVVLKQCR